jgi:trans-AT polyketide synthase, acyltransferase and oxidoreductase domains
MSFHPSHETGPAAIPAAAWRAALAALHRPVYASNVTGSIVPSHDFTPQFLAYLPPLPPEHLGLPGFRQAHRVHYNYVTGAMANGIASTDLVCAVARAGMLGFFGAAGLSLPRIENALQTLHNALPGQSFGANLIHSPNDQAHELATARLYLKHRLPVVEASAYLDLTPAIVAYRCKGLALGADGKVHIAQRVMAKISRPEVATRFLSPPPARLLAQCLADGDLTAEECELAKRIPMADDLTIEADSGGHTDNRPAISLFPAIQALRDRLQTQFGFVTPVRLGAAGGIATPASLAAAWAMGADYVVTGSINQACVESGSCDAVRLMLSQAEIADVTMAPAADMFEMGVKVQVLKRGTMFAMRASKLYELYRQYPSLEAIPARERDNLEKNLFKAPLEQIDRETQAYFAERDPAQNAKAKIDAKHRMALVFRWYLGQSSRWANAGIPERRLDYQIWCGPAMGAFNEWTRGTPLAEPANRKAVDVARALLTGCCHVLRRHQLAMQGLNLPEECTQTRPLNL